MDFMTLLGLGGSFLVVTAGILLTGAGIGNYASLPSIFITLGGSFGAMAAMQNSDTLRNFFRVFSLAFKHEEVNYFQIVATMVSFSEKARREGLLSLEEDLDHMEETKFLKTGLQLVIDGTEPEVVRQVLLSDITSMETRHGDTRKMFSDLALLSPTFGLIGTLIGLILMLASLGSGNIELIGQGMSAALLTTLYGAYLSYAIWLPISNKLEKKTANEAFYKEIIVEGVLSLQFGDNPKMMQQKLASYFPSELKDDLYKEVALPTN